MEMEPVVELQKEGLRAFLSPTACGTARWMTETMKGVKNSREGDIGEEMCDK